MQLVETFNAHRREVWAFILNRTGSAADSEDILQDAFIRFTEHGHNAEQPAAYLWQICQNLICDRGRFAGHRFSREMRVATSETYKVTPDQLAIEAEEEAEKARQLKAVTKAVAELTPGEAQAVRETLQGKPLSATGRSHKRHAITRLRKLVSLHLTLAL